MVGAMDNDNDTPAVPSGVERARPTPPSDGLVQVGWMNPTTGVMCDCPVYELSPHANSVPVWAEKERNRG